MFIHILLRYEQNTLKGTCTAFTFTDLRKSEGSSKFNKGKFDRNAIYSPLILKSGVCSVCAE